MGYVSMSIQLSKTLLCYSDLSPFVLLKPKRGFPWDMAGTVWGFGFCLNPDWEIQKEKRELMARSLVLLVLLSFHICLLLFTFQSLQMASPSILSSFSITYSIFPELEVPAFIIIIYFFF